MQEEGTGPRWLRHYYYGHQSEKTFILQDWTLALGALGY